MKSERAKIANRRAKEHSGFYRAAIRKSDWRDALFAAADVQHWATVGLCFAKEDSGLFEEGDAKDWLVEAGEMFAHIAKEL